MSTLKDLSDRLHDVLSSAMCERANRDEWVPVGLTETELAWVLYERQVMVEEVNRLRANRGLTAIDQADVERVERMAVGHSDYSRQFAFGCARLVVSPEGDTP